MECNITVPDKTMSGKHATILFKNDKFKIKDELSSHGTFVNDRDIEEETVELHDNDIIRLGETILKIKIAL
jgi:pSer/pThr/pTyr-binding forkhead associated (FHA) protein